MADLTRLRTLAENPEMAVTDFQVMTRAETAQEGTQ